MTSRLPSSSSLSSFAEMVCSREYFEKSGKSSASKDEHRGQVCRRLPARDSPFPCGSTAFVVGWNGSLLGSDPRLRTRNIAMKVPRTVKLSVRLACLALAVSKNEPWLSFETGGVPYVVTGS